MTLKKKLEALNYPFISNFNITEEHSFQQLISWLEDVKLRFYKIEERDNLRKMNENWNNYFYKYLIDLKCPIPFSNPMSISGKSN
jgi:hypothetical protein